jgi:Bacteriophage tail sheath protein
MPTQVSYPGVYIEEIPSGVRPIAGVSTSVAAFVGYFTRAPLNFAIKVFNMGDFQREFGGLHPDSETSYAVSQFFQNGGTEAWIVRTASNRLNNSDLPGPEPEAAGATLKDSNGVDVLEINAGRLMADGESYGDQGQWGNNLRVDVDYDTEDPNTQFNLTVSEIEPENNRERVVNSETYRNLTMAAGPRNAVAVVNEQSKLIQVDILNPTTALRPVPTGNWGSDASGSFGTISNNDVLTIEGLPNPIPSQPPITQNVTLNFVAAPADLQGARILLETAIRSSNPDNPLLTGATVRLINNQFQVLAGRNGANYNPEMLLTFTNSTGTPATALGLTGAGSLMNVQQYMLGSTNNSSGSVGFRGATDVGVDGFPPHGNELRGDPAAKRGIYALDEVDIFNILCLPRAANLTAPETTSVISAAETFCEKKRAFLIIDLPPNIDTWQEAQAWLDQNAGLRHQNAAAYFPRLRIPDSENDFRLRNVGPSGTLAGLYARTDTARGVWKAPAGIEGTLRNVSELAYPLTDQENGQLNPLGLNSLRNFRVAGNVAWGARTLVGADTLASDWKYIPVRRLALFLEESLYRGSKWVVFEPNDEPLWAQIRSSVGSFMQRLFRQGAFQGTTPRQAYLVKCDGETTTQADIDLGVVNILVGFAPLKPAEFVIIKIQQLAGQDQS